MKATKVISLINQKGGVGKSTISLFIANFLQYNKGYNVALVDSDNIQLSIYRQRLEEYKIYEKSTTLQEIVKEQKTPSLYEIVAVQSSQKIEKIIKELKESNRFDFIIIDTKGALSDSIHSTALLSDYIFVPIVPKDQVCKSTAFTLKFFDDLKIANSKIYLIWNLQKKTQLVEKEKDNFVKKYFSSKNIVPISITDRINIPRRDFSNTLYYNEKNMILETGELHYALDEILKIIKQ